MAFVSLRHEWRHFNREEMRDIFSSWNDVIHDYCMWARIDPPWSLNVISQTFVTLLYVTLVYSIYIIIYIFHFCVELFITLYHFFTLTLYCDSFYWRIKQQFRRNRNHLQYFIFPWKQNHNEFMDNNFDIYRTYIEH